MRYLKAIAAGIVGALLAPVLLLLLMLLVTIVYGGVAATGGGGIAGFSFGMMEIIPILTTLAGFIAGFWWALRRRPMRRTSS